MPRAKRSEAQEQTRAHTIEMRGDPLVALEEIVYHLGERGTGLVRHYPTAGRELKLSTLHRMQQPLAHRLVGVVPETGQKNHLIIKYFKIDTSTHFLILIN